jgi:hypothetical protein
VLLAARLAESVPVVPVPDIAPVVVAPPDMVTESVLVLVTLVESVVLAVFLLHAVIAAPAANARNRSRADLFIIMLVLPP